MRAGVYDRVCLEIFRQIRIVFVAVESELQDAHARKIKTIPHRRYIRGDQPQVLGDEGQPAQLLFDGLE